MLGFFKKQDARSVKEIDPEEIFMDSINLPGHDRVLFEGQIERPIGSGIFRWWLVVAGVGLLLIAGRLFHLQFQRGEYFSMVSNKNISYVLSVAPPRGIIYDSSLEPLAANTTSFALVLRQRDLVRPEDFAGAVALGAKLVGKTVEAVWRANRDVSESADVPDSDRLSDHSAWPDEIVFDHDIPRALLLRVAAAPKEFSGITVEESVRRIYPFGLAASHVLGFLGLPSKNEGGSAERYRSGTRRVGKDGLEFSYEEFLRGVAGRKIIEIDAVGTQLRERFLEPATPGKSVVLSLDANLQRRAYEVTERHLRAAGKKAGAVVMSDPRDGRILALVSVPGYENGVLSAGKDREEIRAMLSDPRHPLFHRAISGRYAPGSTVKPMFAVAALEEAVIGPAHQIFDEGFISVPNPYDPANPSIFRDWSKLGWVDMRRAIAYSANVYFYTIGGGYKEVRGLGIERIQKFMERFGFGALLGIDLPGEATGLIPGPEVKKQTRPNDPFWRIGDTYISSIGQGDTLATPLQINFMTAVVANGGQLFRPRIAARILGDGGEVIKEYPPEIIRENIAKTESFDIVRQGMRMAVTEGSARSLSEFPVAVSGKTGTAQTGVVGKNHGWFTGFAPSESPEVAITVLVEEGTGGSTDAVPIAKEILWTWLADRNKMAAGPTNAQE